tara:strand:+ start:2135 stop:3346 length:1212 start_codon:yes stop_codon:yes gene_type:complete
MILNTFFDKIYVINLKESIDRKNHIINEFKKNKIIKYEFFEATHFDDKSVSELLNSEKVFSFPPCFRCLKNRCSCENNFLTKYQIANWLSYLNLFQKILESNDDLILICEDDIVFSENSNYILTSLLNKKMFDKHKINFNLPLLIKMGCAYDPITHNVYDKPRYIKNYSLSNPCFAVNKQMVKFYLYNLKIIDYHSDIYFHKKIPYTFKNLQTLVMNPFPVYELSFVDSVKKFNSLIRPKNELRRKEYKEFLFVTSNKLLEIVAIRFSKKLKLNISKDKMGFNGNINSFTFFKKEYQELFYFKYKILLKDSREFDISFINNNIENDEIISFLKSVININNLSIDITNKKDITNNIHIIYDSYLLLFKDYITYDINNFDKNNINKDLLESIKEYINFKTDNFNL